jgi:hypothetical protein
MWLLRSFRFSSYVAECPNTLEQNFPLSGIDIPTAIFLGTAGFDMRPAIAWGRFADQATL